MLEGEDEVRVLLEEGDLEEKNGGRVRLLLLRVVVVEKLLFTRAITDTE